MDCVNILSSYRNHTLDPQGMQSLSRTVREGGLSNPDNVFSLEAAQMEFSEKIENLSVI